MCLHRAVDQFGQVIDVLLTDKRDLRAARRFFKQALSRSTRPVEVITDRAGVYPTVLDEVLPDACHIADRYANNRVESDHARLKARLRPMRGLKRPRSAVAVAAGHALVEHIRRGHYELAVDVNKHRRVAAHSRSS